MTTDAESMLYTVDHIEEKKLKLENILVDFFASNDEAIIISKLMEVLDISPKDLNKHFLAYNLDIHSFDNAIYESLENRLVLFLHNLIKGSWHQSRQEAIQSILASINITNMIDIGFGSPSKYIRNNLFNRHFSITLCDLYDTAFDFARQVFDIWGENWKECIRFKKIDMNEHQYVGDYDLYLFQDSIEHVKQPSLYLEQLVSHSPENAYFLFSLPIAPIIPAHYIAWETIDEAIYWLEKHDLYPIKSILNKVNPKVDLFADSLDFTMENLVILCRKAM